jgi:peroxiredoxin
MKIILFALCLGIISNSLYAQEKPEGLFINSKAPDFKATDQNGNVLVLKELRKTGPVILVFYRGYWSPYCTKYLKTLQDSLELIKEKGAHLLAVSPEVDSAMFKTLESIQPGYSVISDLGMKIMNAYEVKYKVNDKEISRLKISNIDLAKNNAQKPDDVYLPVPAVYIIGKDGEIKYRFFDPDYKKRATVGEILQNLKGLK